MSQHFWIIWIENKQCTIIMQERHAKREQERLVGHGPMKYFIAWSKQAKNMQTF
jgi:hypothetical protein